MKKTMVLAVSALVLGLILAGCPQPGNDNNGNLVDDNGGVTPVPPVPPISITIEISGHDGNFGSSVLLDAHGNVVASSAPVEITSGSVTMELLNAQTDAPFATTGDFTLMFVISEDEDGEEVVWFGSAEKSLDGGEIAMDLDEDFDGPEESVAGPSDDYRTLPDSALEGSLEDRFNWLRRNAQSGNTYLITVGTDAPLAPQALSFFGRNDVTVIVRGNGRPTISLSERGHLFSIGSGVTLELENVILQGRADNHLSLVGVWGGTLVMEEGSKVTGNTRTPGSGAGVMVGGGGTLIMRDGEIYGNHSRYEGWVGGAGVTVWAGGIFRMYGGVISHNTVTRLPNPDNSVLTVGGGVRMYGIFTMEGGTISHNTAHIGVGVNVSNEGAFTMRGGYISHNIAPDGVWSSGGGVSVGNNRIFTMEGGTISHNAAQYGGGVTVDGTFVMHYGTISYNNASHSNHGTRGGGVRVGSGGSFTMYDGTISNNTASGGSWSSGGGVAVDCGNGNAGIFRMRGGAISGNHARDSGGGVFVSGWYGHSNPVGGRFFISDGIIHGSNATDALRNTAGDYWGRVALYNSNLGTAQHGTFDTANVFTKIGYLSTTNYTIEVEDGVLQGAVSITIEGISRYNNWGMNIMLWDLGMSYVVAYAWGIQVTGDSATFTFFADPGDYNIELSFSMDGVAIPYRMLSRNISAGTNNIPLSDFDQPIVITIMDIPSQYRQGDITFWRYQSGIGTGLQIAGNLGIVTFVDIFDPGVYNIELRLMTDNTWTDYHASSINISTGRTEIPWSAFTRVDSNYAVTVTITGIPSQYQPYGWVSMIFRRDGEGLHTGTPITGNTATFTCFHWLRTGAIDIELHLRSNGTQVEYLASSVNITAGANANVVPWSYFSRL